MNIVLIGFMGTGKTTIAEKLALKTGMRYISTDEMIEKKEKIKISDLFARKGEPYFRGVERDVVQKISAMDNLIVDAGGGVVIDPANIIDLKKNGLLISLWAEPDIIYARTKKFRHRPILNVADPLGKIKALLAERTPLYERADYHVNTGNMSIDEAVDAISDHFKRKNL